MGKNLYFICGVAIAFIYSVSCDNDIKMEASVCALSRVRLFATPWTVAHQAPLST